MCSVSIIFVAPALFLLLLATTQTTAFSLIEKPRPGSQRHPRQSITSLVVVDTITAPPASTTTTLFMSSLNQQQDSDDPFRILDLSPTADPREIKRAYKRMALKSHPDVVCNSSSTKEERRRANDVFAKINWAYETLSGKNGSKVGGKQASTTSTSSPGGYTPPHRRTTSSPYSTGSKTSSGGGSYSTDWRDYIPNFKEEEEYDDGGDSFGQIFSDLITGAAGAAAGAAGSGGGIFRDFVEFLEDNIDGYTPTAGDDNDDSLYTLLRMGSTKEVGMEMDDTELVVQQLESKQRNVADELLMKQADFKFATKFSERVELEEQIAELQARKRVVDGYLVRARKRLLQLQSRYKELIVSGGDRAYSYASGTGSRSSYSGGGASSSSSDSTRSSASSSTADRRTTTDAVSSSAASNAGTQSGSKQEDGWKTQGFGSSGRRGRGSSRRGRSRPGAASTVDERQQSESSRSSWQSSSSPSPREDYSSSSYSSSSPPPPSRSRSETSSRQSQSSILDEDWKPPVPPHRRTRSEPSQAQKDKKRLRELQVDEEFDRLKKDLGL